MLYSVKFKTTHPVHSAYVEADGTVVAEWYDLTKDRPYDSATTIKFDADGQRELVRALELPATTGANALVDALAARFETYWAVREFADDQQISYVHKVDFDT